MSGLIEPNLNGMTERQFKRKGQMNVTHDELAAELQSLAKAILDAFGPIAQLQGELMLRQSALEDHLGYTYVPKATPESTADSTEPVVNPS